MEPQKPRNTLAYLRYREDHKQLKFFYGPDPVGCVGSFAPSLKPFNTLDGRTSASLRPNCQPPSPFPIHRDRGFCFHFEAHPRFFLPTVSLRRDEERWRRKRRRYPNLKNVEKLIHKRAYGKLNKQRIPVSDNSIIEEEPGEVRDSLHRGSCS
ncbi:hypothetical protein COCNU_11G013180 [Cocos nucifera]|uniref:Uncharacterized protein n=1 Tax=Cocos nucifera TaxID=13894 RepID=A0A8K0N9I3_COCNU|nr:hypothetical protein COCNU_11G013180 [Cocos nucifera]